MLLSVLIVDDDREFRTNMRRFLEKEQWIKILGEARDGFEAVQSSQALLPDVVLMDIAMPRLDGLQATQRIKARMPKVKVIILTVHDEEAYRKAARAYGADGFVLKRNLEALLSSMSKFVEQ